ncbi:pkb-activating kinase-like protein [Tulasnella sp. 408]|nr:pkb-activating kinase-like protein [Tulasnella sp. 408]
MALVQGRFMTPSNTPLAGKLYDLGTQAIGNSGFGAIFTATLVQAGGTSMVVAVKRVLPEVQANAAEVRQTAGALDYLHRCGVVHCDIKPANVLIDDTFAAQLSNFELSTFTHAPMGVAVRSNPDDVGTKGYQAPEILFESITTPQTDVFAFGCFIAANAKAAESVAMLMEGNFLSGNEFRTFPSVLQGLTTRCMLLDSTQRPTMGEVVCGLSSVQL